MREHQTSKLNFAFRIFDNRLMADDDGGKVQFGNVVRIPCGKCVLKIYILPPSSCDLINRRRVGIVNFWVLQLCVCVWRGESSFSIRTRFVGHKIRVDRAKWNGASHTYSTNAIDFVCADAHEHKSKIFSRLHKMVRESKTFYTFRFSFAVVRFPFIRFKQQWLFCLFFFVFVFLMQAHFAHSIRQLLATTNHALCCALWYMGLCVSCRMAESRA